MSAISGRERPSPASTAEQAVRCVIAYEPLWAIGTGNTATSAQAQEVCAVAFAPRSASSMTLETAKAISILYGGSMNRWQRGRAAEHQPDIDGGLIGGASLKPVDFVEDRRLSS